MKVTTTVIVEIKGVKHELTQAEAKLLLAALNAAVGAQPTVWPAPIFVKDPHQDRSWLDKLDVRCGVAQQGS